MYQKVCLAYKQIPNRKYVIFSIFLKLESSDKWDENKNAYLGFEILGREHTFHRPQRRYLKQIQIDQ